MKLPSLTQLAHNALKTFRRFPLVLLNAVLGTIAALILADQEGKLTTSFLFPVLLASILGVPLLTALALIAEKRNFRLAPSILLQLGGVIVLVLYSLVVPQSLPNEPAMHLIRFFLLAAAAHLFVSVGPFLSAGQVNGFWHFNKSLFLKILISLLYSAVLYTGLAIALAALDNLFGVDVPGRRYFELWILIVGLFHTWVFLSGVPEDLNELETLTDYPKGLRVFAQYILFPLLGVYLIILYAYLGKIVISWEWPHGWVSKLIIGFAVTGISSALMIHPIAEKVENAWMRASSRRFTLVLIPLVPLLVLAVWRRVSEYGWTEERYLAMGFGLWLTAYIVYFTLSKAKNIKVIPLSLCIAALFVGFGPWGAFAVSETSQIAQLQRLLEQESVLVDGTIRAKHDTLSYNDSGRISSIITYLHDIHGWGGISKWFVATDPDVPVLPPTEDPASVAKRMGVSYVRTWQIGTGGTIMFTVDNNGTADIGGFDRALRIRRFTTSHKSYSNDDFGYRVDPNADSITVYARREGKEVDSLEIDVRRMVEGLMRDYGRISTDHIPPERMSLSGQSPTLKVKICLSLVRVQREDDRVTSMAYDGDVYYAIKSENR